MVKMPIKQVVQDLFALRRRLDITLFGFMQTQEAWRIAERMLKDHLVYFVVDHGLRGVVAGESIEVEAPALLWLTPGVPHAFVSQREGRPLRLYHLRFRQSGSAGLRPAWCVVPGAGRLRPAFVELFDEHHAAQRSEARVRAVLSALLIDSQRETNPSASRAALSLAQQRKLQSLAQSCGFRVTPTELARDLRLSPDYFRRLFHRTYRCSPRSWIIARRVEHAAALLVESDVGVSELADRLGYSDVFQFSRQFKQLRGVSPRTHRGLHNLPG